MTEDGGTGGLFDPASVAIWSAFFLTIVLFVSQSHSINLELYILLAVGFIVVLIGANYVLKND